MEKVFEGPLQDLLDALKGKRQVIFAELSTEDKLALLAKELLIQTVQVRTLAIQLRDVKQMLVDHEHNSRGEVRFSPTMLEVQAENVLNTVKKEKASLPFLLVREAPDDGEPHAGPDPEAN